MLRDRLTAGLLFIVWIWAINCGGNTRDSGGGRTGGAANEDGSAGFAARAGNAGVGGSINTGGTGLAGSGSLGSGGNGAAGSGGSGTVGFGGTAAGGSGGSGGLVSCSASVECVVRSRSCCGECGAATRGDVIAIARVAAGPYSRTVCGESGCPACYRPQDPTLLARCENASCAVVDLLELPLTECQADSDCRVRTASCCECGGNVSLDSLIAIRKDSEPEFQRITCDGITDCDACIPVYPEMAKAACHNGRCTVTGQPGTTPI